MTNSLSLPIHDPRVMFNTHYTIVFKLLMRRYQLFLAFLKEPTDSHTEPTEDFRCLLIKAAPTALTCLTEQWNFCTSNSQNLS